MTERNVSEKPVMLITGSRKGIGRYLCEYYLQKGYLVEGCSRGVSDLKDPGYKHHEVDVAEERAVRLMVADITKRHGAENRVSHRMADRVAIGVASAMNICFDVDPTESHRTTRCKPM